MVSGRPGRGSFPASSLARRPRLITGVAYGSSQIEPLDTIHSFPAGP